MEVGTLAGTAQRFQSWFGRACLVHDGRGTVVVTYAGRAIAHSDLQRFVQTFMPVGSAVVFRQSDVDARDVVARRGRALDVAVLLAFVGWLLAFVGWLQ